MGLLKSIASKIGIDKSIAYSSGARVVQALAGVLSIFFISIFLTGIEQGFYYTFGSILALQVFFEMGLTGIMTQYVAHEASHLTLDTNGEYQGEEKYRSRLASLVHFCVKWYTVLALLVFVFLNIVGFVYFNRYGVSQGEEVLWSTPWSLICISTSIQLFISPLTSILKGLGYVKETSKISFFQQLIVPLCTWIGLACGLKLYVTGIGYLISSLIWFVLVARLDLVRVLYNLWRVPVTERVAYMTEIFPFQWKIALSWISGYFIFQLFNPVLFATEGALVAGQMGMTLQALNAINAFAMSWINTKVPLFSNLVALKNYTQLDDVFNKTLKQMIFVCTFLLTSFFSLIVFLNVTQLQIGSSILAERFLPYIPMVLMMVSVLLSQYVFAWATYLRCHKQEPFLWNSVVIGVLSLLSTLILGNYFGLYGIVLGYFSLRILSNIWGRYTFVTYKNRWHGK